jgi:hypothetical protein
MLPEKLLKPKPGEEIDPGRVKRIIRFQGVFNVILIIALVGCIGWYFKYGKLIEHRVFSDAFNPPVRVTMPLHVFGEQRRLNPTDVVHDPIIVVFGKVDDYANLREILDRFTVLVRKTTVTPNLTTGEFAEKIALKPGRNEIDIVIKWDEQERYRYQYTISYIKPAPDDVIMQLEEPATP